ITHLYIPADRKSPLREAEKHGLALLQSLNEKQLRIPSILVTPLFDTQLINATNDIFYCKLVIEGTDKWDDYLVKLSRKALEDMEDNDIEINKLRDGIRKKIIKRTSNNGNKEERKIARVDIALDLDNKRWSYRLKGIGVPYDISNILKIDP